jgi:nucleoside-diphosphate-sugar epimerase
MRYLVTGGAGFIGSSLVRLLLEEGCAVEVLDDLSTGRRENLAGLGKGVRLHVGSIEEAALVERCAAGSDGIFHLAAVASVPKSMAEPAACHNVNVNGWLNVLEAARKLHVPRLVFASSAAVYGDSQALPLAEDTPCLPISPYGLHKLIGEQYGRLYSRLGWAEVVCLRFFNVFGPRQDPKGEYGVVIPRFLEAFRRGAAPVVFGDGRQSRDFMAVDDVARVNLLAMRTPGIAGETINVCAGRETSLLDLISALGEISGRCVAPRFEPPRPGDIRRSVGSCDKAMRLLSPGPWSRLAEGLRRAWEHLGDE